MVVDRAMAVDMLDGCGDIASSIAVEWMEGDTWLLSEEEVRDDGTDLIERGYVDQVLRSYFDRRPAGVVLWEYPAGPDSDFDAPRCPHLVVTASRRSFVANGITIPWERSVLLCIRRYDYERTPEQCLSDLLWGSRIGFFLQEGLRIPDVLDVGALRIVLERCDEIVGPPTRWGSFLRWRKLVGAAKGS